MVTNRVCRLSSVALLSCTPQTGTLYFLRPTILKYCNYCLQRSSDRIQVCYYKQDLLNLIVLRFKPQHNLPSLSASNDVIVNKKHFGTFSVVSVCLGPPRVAPSVLHFVADFWLYHKHDQGKMMLSAGFQTSSRHEPA